MFEETVLSAEKVFEGKLLTLNRDIVKLQNGAKANREFVKTSDASCILALDNLKNLILVRQYRYAHKNNMLEIPAGRIEYKESPLNAAKREFFEETGYASNDWEQLHILNPATYSTQKLYIFSALNVYFKDIACPDDGEFLELVKMPFIDALNMVLNGDIKDSKSVVGILKFYILNKNFFE